MSFVCCTGCDRHVRVEEAACPFCGAAVEAAGSSPRVPEGRHGRVARMAFGAGLLFTVTACPAYGAPEDFDGGPSARDAGSDAGPAAMDAGGEDAGPQDAGSLDDAGEDAGEAQDAGEAEDAGDETDAG